jgi:hypothetical protein
VLAHSDTRPHFGDPTFQDACLDVFGNHVPEIRAADLDRSGIRDLLRRLASGKPERRERNNTTKRALHEQRQARR